MPDRPLIRPTRRAPLALPQHKVERPAAASMLLLFMEVLQHLPVVVASVFEHGCQLPEPREGAIVEDRRGQSNRLRAPAAALQRRLVEWVAEDLAQKNALAD